MPEAAQPLALAFQPFELSLVSGRIIRSARGAEAPLEGCFAEFERKLFQAGYALNGRPFSSSSIKAMIEPSRLVRART